uniref:Aldose 1-epimerase n=1 Tax=Haptolina brevifila TaxID=156173 RepID=A0A7S2DPN4_9EUKA|mmetsp:Transcript_41748/g.83768  ORF Transcript_41748/g.83768 Transcript_41748/m.83768 type:complete len:228 (+) Transcript_41748:486-1169(+)
MPRATHMLPIDAHRIPTGELAPVRGTAFDFTTPHTLGSRIQDVDGPGWRAGYDHCFVLHGRTQRDASPADGWSLTDGPAADGWSSWWLSRPKLAAKLYDPSSGRIMEILTNAPGLQLYTSNFLDGTGEPGKGGVRYQHYGGVCLETQSFPDGVHHQPGGGRTQFPTGILRPGQTYRHVTIYRFSVDTSGGHTSTTHDGALQAGQEADTVEERARTAEIGAEALRSIY